MVTDKKKALICGVSGQDGAYLARLLLSNGYDVYGTSRDADQPAGAELLCQCCHGKLYLQLQIITITRWEKFGGKVSPPIFICILLRRGCTDLNSTLGV